jgi:glycosyltransferase involved in cell wall biosynthesis
MSQPTLSIITIVYNDVKHIERTIRSVVGQTYPYIEYLVIDGASTDGTLNILEKYRSEITQILSEKDKGIYDAMNKGLALATGDYVLFMNSGDEIYAPDTVEKIFDQQPFADIYYGETEMIDQNLNSLGQRRHKVPEQLTVNSFKYGMSVCHQAIYVKKSLCSFYNTTYQLSADIDWILNALGKAHNVVNTHRYVARYLVGGMSKKRHWQSLKERFRIMAHYYGLVPTIINHFCIAFNLLSYYLKNRKTND